MANTKLAILAGLAVVGTVAAFLIVGSTGRTSFKGLKDDANLQAVYSSWKTQNNKTYGGAEDKMRFHVFSANYYKVQAHTAKNLTYTIGLTQFADLTHDEFASIYLGYKPHLKSHSLTKGAEKFTGEGVVAPATVDWRTKGAVTPVKNQGQCGSCWSFSTTGALEGRNFVANGNLVSLSEQELVDCSGSFGNQGCNGGLMDNAFEFSASKGLTTESNYPYTAQDGKCNAAKEGTVAAKNKGHTDVTPNSDSALAAAVAQGPVSVAVEADQDCWQLYTGGVVPTKSCGTALDHGVLVVGYTSDPAWIVKNSWGASWGENGYIRLARTTGADNKSNAGTCGILSDPSFPTF